MNETQNPVEQAMWIAKSLFDRGKTSGSSANLSFRHDGKIYITGSGTCFGTLTPESFAVLSKAGKHISGPAPSKEYPLHMALYKKHPDIHAVIHTHSFHSVLMSCLPHKDPEDIIPPYTPYLRMQLGRVAFVPYAPPGSKKLFNMFSKRVSDTWGYILANHGPIVGGKTLMAAFYALEELEESAKVAWTLRNESDAAVITLQ